MSGSRRMVDGSSDKVRGQFDTIESIEKVSDYRKAVGAARSAVYIIFALSLLIFIVIAAIAIYKEGAAQFIETMESINPWYFLLSLVIILFSYTMRYPKWSMYLHDLGVHIPTGRNFAIYMSMYSMDVTPGRWGRAIVSYTMNRLSGVRFARTFPAVVADIFTDFIGFAVLADLMAVVVGKFVIVSFIITFLLVVPFFFIYVEKPFRHVKGWLIKARRRWNFLKRLDVVIYTATLYFKYNRRLGWKSFVFSMVLTVPSMFLNGMALYVTMLAFGVPLGASYVPIVLFIFSSSLVLGMVTGIPGTLGVTDAALISQLQIFFPSTINLGLASAITIFFRISSVWFVQGFGLTALLYTMRYWKD